MERIFALIGRFFWVAIGFIVASYAAGGFLAITSGIWRNFIGIDPSVSGFEGAPITQFEIFLVIGVTGSLLGRAFFLPAMVAIAVSEVFRLRSALASLLGGVAVAFVAGYLGDALPEHGNFRRGWEILLATGVVAGGVYWLIAGHRAGRWQDAGRRKELPAKEDSKAPDAASE
ncbi:MAG: hypothetical protein C0606_08830 [Hyphomicrobiales bacterium]|nr:MAG: hypothetical protein C0606_08830 [Hyphomicrobiales bacterium]